jgi:hypothetical protein
MSTTTKVLLAIGGALVVGGAVYGIYWATRPARPQAPRAPASALNASFFPSSGAPFAPPQAQQQANAGGSWVRDLGGAIDAGSRLVGAFGQIA